MAWRRTPLFVFFLMAAGLAMFVPMFHAGLNRDWLVARTFLHIALLVLIFSGMLSLALMNRTTRNTARSHLGAVFAAFLILPIVLAWPLITLIPTLTPVRAYFEMVSALTTTGFTGFSNAADLHPTLHLWRILVGWMGGFLMLLAAVSIMAPLNIGGFEIQSVVQGLRPGQGWRSVGQAEASDRIVRNSARLAPIYLGLTALMTILLLFTGQDPFLALTHAMSILSTSGMSAVDGPIAATGGIFAETIILVFMAIGATAIVYDRQRSLSIATVKGDSELRLMGIIVLCLTMILFLRHFFGALGVDAVNDLGSALKALWGGLFTLTSFVTTTGVQSIHWDSAQSWSGLPTPGLILVGIMMIGGGVASTAGGVKLLRIYALYKHGVREMRRLTLPNSIGGSGYAARRIRREGAFIAWLVVMLFLISTAIIMLILTFLGLEFEQALILTISALSNCGVGYDVLAADPLRLADLDTAVHMTLCAAMVLGRLEALAVIALLNPAFWRE